MKCCFSPTICFTQRKAHAFLVSFKSTLQLVFTENERLYVDILGRQKERQVENNCAWKLYDDTGISTKTDREPLME